MAFIQTKKTRTNLAIDRPLATGNAPSDSVFVPPLLSDQTPVAVLRLKNVMAQTGLSRSAVYDRLDPASRRCLIPRANSSWRKWARGWMAVD